MSTATWPDLLSFDPGWGLRGDPFLWKELTARLATEPLPTSEAELFSHYAATYLALVGVPLTDSGFVYLERHAHGGMSSGHIDPQTFRERAWREISARWRRIHPDEAPAEAR